MHEIGKLLKCHFFVESRPDFLLQSVILCRCQITVTLQQCREKGFWWMDTGVLHIGQSSVLGWRCFLARLFKDKGCNALNARSRLPGSLLKPNGNAHGSLLSCKALFWNGREREVKSRGIWRKNWPIPTSCADKKICFSAAYVSYAAKIFYQNLVFLSSMEIVLLCLQASSAEPGTSRSATVKCCSR